jgi:hypothetical protein
MIDHDIVRLHVSVHYALAVAEVESLSSISTYPTSYEPHSYLQELKDIIPDIVVDEFRVEGSEICVIDVFEDKGGRFALHQE